MGCQTWSQYWFGNSLFRGDQRISQKSKVKRRGKVSICWWRKPSTLPRSHGSRSWSQGKLKELPWRGGDVMWRVRGWGSVRGNMDKIELEYLVCWGWRRSLVPLWELKLFLENFNLLIAFIEIDEWLAILVFHLPLSSPAHPLFRSGAHSDQELSPDERPHAGDAGQSSILAFI